MKIAAIIIGLLLISALFLVACQQSSQTPTSEENNNKATGDAAQTQSDQAIDPVAADEVEIGEMI